MMTLKDKVRVMCHQIKMDGLAGIDPAKLEGYRSRIRALPSAEAMSSMSKSDLYEVKVRVDRLVTDIDRDRFPRDMNSALENRSLRGLPPHRQPVLASIKTWIREAESFDSIGLSDTLSMPDDLPVTEDDIQYQESSGCPVCGSMQCVPIKTPGGEPDEVKCKVCGSTYSQLTTLNHTNSRT